MATARSSSSRRACQRASTEWLWSTSWAAVRRSVRDIRPALVIQSLTPGFDYAQIVTPSEYLAPTDAGCYYNCSSACCVNSRPCRG